MSAAGGCGCGAAVAAGEVDWAGCPVAVGAVQRKAPEYASVQAIYLFSTPAVTDILPRDVHTANVAARNAHR